MCRSSSLCRHLLLDTHALNVRPVACAVVVSCLQELERHFEQAHKAYLESTEHRTQAFKQLTKNDAQAARVIEKRMKKLVKLQVGLWTDRMKEDGWLKDGWLQRLLLLIPSSLKDVAGTVAACNLCRRRCNTGVPRSPPTAASGRSATVRCAMRRRS